MDDIKKLSQDHLDGLISGEEYYVRLMDMIAHYADDLEADERMLALAQQFVK